MRMLVLTVLLTWSLAAGRRIPANTQISAVPRPPGTQRKIFGVGNVRTSDATLANLPHVHSSTDPKVAQSSLATAGSKAGSRAGTPSVFSTASRRTSGGSRSVKLQAVDDKAEVKEYFNNEGFNRWNKIYSEDGEVNPVQLDIRKGHAETVDKVLAWVSEDGTAKAGQRFCDVGCGVGSLALPLAELGGKVDASDISAAMVQEATRRAADAGMGDRVSFSTSDLESVGGSYDTVTCIDVMIHYPEEKMAEMVKGLAQRAERRIILSFAPDTWYYRFLKSIGEFFPGPAKTTRAYLHSEEAVVAALREAGFSLGRTEMTGTSFYFSRLLEAEKV